MIKLTITHLTILGPARARDDGLIARPPSLKPAVAAKLAAKLIEHGLARELRAKDDMPIWRTDGDKPFSLKLLKAGRIAVETAEQSQVKISATDMSTASMHSRLNAAVIPAEQPAASDNADAAAPASTARAGSKRAKVIALLHRPNGASMGELIAATGWLPHTTRAALSGLRKGDLTLECFRDEELTTRYRMTEPEDKAAIEDASHHRARQGVAAGAKNSSSIQAAA